MISFDKVVNKLWRKSGKIIFRKDIVEIINPEWNPRLSKFVNRMIYLLTSQNILKIIRNGVYVFPDEEDKKLNEIDLIEKYFFSLMKGYISKEVGNEYFLSGKKSLEIHMKNYSVSEKTTILNRKLNKKIKLGNMQLVFTTAKGKQKNVYQKLSQFSQSVKIEGINLHIANLELSLVQATLIENTDEWIDWDLIKKTLKKYASFFKKEIFYEIGKLKYNMAFNRLKEFSKHIDEDLYQTFLDIIKKNGGNFVGEWLRKM